MRITYLHQYFNTPEMSGGTRSFEMARRLVAMGHEVNMVTSLREHDAREDWFITNESGINVHWLPIPYSNEMSDDSRIRAFFRFAWSAARKAAAISADVVFATSTPLTIALPGIYSSRKLKLPMVFEVRDLWPELPIAIGALRNPVIREAAFLLERFAYQSSKEIVVLSPGMATGVIRVGFPAARVTEIPNSADIGLFYPNPTLGKEFRSRHKIADNKLLIVYAGTFGRINGVSYLVHLAQALRDDHRFHFLSVGGGQEFLPVHALACEARVLGKNFTMLERLPKAQIPAVLAAADIAASLFLPIPQMEANSANKFFDGLAAGCCLAINYGGWQAELLKDTGAGLRFDHDPLAAARQLQDLADDPERLTYAKIAARRLAEERFSRDTLAAQLERVLVRAVEGDAGRPHTRAAVRRT